MSGSGHPWSWSCSGQYDGSTASCSASLQTWSLLPSASTGGSIDPPDAVSIDDGGNRTFTIAPGDGYFISTVLIDGVPVGPVTSYTFNPVEADHSISAVFAEDNYALAPSAGPGGSISPGATVVVNKGGSQTFTITPSENYHVADILVDSVSVGLAAGHTFTDITADHTISATFSIDTRTITASTGTNGAISPAGDVPVNYEGSQAFTITPSANYHVADVLVNGFSVGPVNSFIFTNVTTTNTISATFASDTRIISASTGSGGGISPAGNLAANYGSDHVYTITASANYHIADVLVDDVPIGPVNSYTFTNVTTDHTIIAAFAIDTFTVSTSAGPNGSISTDQVVPYNTATSFTVIAAPGYSVALVSGCSGTLTGPDIYTTGLITEDCTVAASFIDSTAPALMVSTPASDSITNNQTPNIEGRVSDNGGLQSLVISGTTITVNTDNTFVHVITLATGSNTITTIATDLQGNSITDTRIVTFDEVVPSLMLSTLADGSYTNNPVLNLTGTATDDIAFEALLVSRQTLTEVVTTGAGGSFSHSITLQSGANTIETIAADAAGNMTTDTRTITLDEAAPSLTVTAPADNSITNEIISTITGTVDESVQSVLVSIGTTTINAEVIGSSFTATINLASGENTIDILATDLAGNTSTAKRTVTFDNQGPSLAITDPNQDIRANQNSYLLKGTVTDMTGIVVTVNIDGTVSTPTVTAGAFEQTVTFSTEKTYAVIVTATDSADNTTIVQRNIIYDITPSAITINPISSPTNQETQAITGTMEPGSTVDIVCSTATVGPVSYPSTTTWQAMLTTLTPGANSVSVTATDNTGNLSSAVSASIVLDITRPDTAISTGPASIINSAAATFTFTLTEAGSFECRLDTGSYSSCISPMTYTTLSEGSHLFFVRAIDQAGNTDESPAQYAWIMDTIAPTGTATPSGGLFNTTKNVTLSATDSAIYYTANGDIPTISSTLYTAPIAIAADTTLKFFALDMAGNAGVASTEVYIIDGTIPSLTVSTLARNSYTNNPVLNLTGTVTDNIAVQSLVVRHQTLAEVVTLGAGGSFSHSITLQAGPNIIEAIATDAAGNTTTDTRTISLDETAPALFVTGPADSSITNEVLSAVTGTVEENTTVSIAVNTGSPAYAIMTGTSFTYTATLIDGINTLDITVTDLAGNTTSVKRTVTYDNVSPALAITSPNQDTRTSQASFTVSGTISDTAAVSMLITCSTASVGFVSNPTATTWQVDITNMTPGTNTITVTATDQAGNSMTATRNIIFDSTAPTVTVNTVASPTNENSQTMSGTMEQGATISVTCPTAAVGIVSYPTATTWQADITNMTEGSNSITAIAIDTAGNQTNATAVIVLDTVAATATLSGVPQAVTNQTTVVLTVNGTNVVSYRYAFDNGNYSAETSTAIAFSSIGLAEGSHSVSVIGKDAAGNWQPEQAATTASWIIDLTAPVLTLSTLADASVTKSQTLNISGTAIDSGGIQGLVVSGQSVTVQPDNSFSLFVTLNPGSNTITTMATDLAGNTATDSRVITLDQSAPGLTITSPADNSFTNQLVSSVTGTVDEAVQSVLICDGTTTITAAMTANGFSADVNLAPGMNTIDITATDPAGNTSSGKRTVIYDPAAPSLAVTIPAQDTIVTAPTVTITGTVSDTLTTSAVLVSIGTATYTPTVTAGTFSQTIVLPAEGAYTINVTATDEAGNTSSVTRNIIYIKLGDLDADGDVDVADALKALRIAAGIDTASASEQSRGDVAPIVNNTPTPDGKIDIGDVVVILRKAVGLGSW